MAQDRIDANELVLTHEFLALMLGVRRSGVTVFEGQGMISLSRGSVTIEDRDGIEETANRYRLIPIKLASLVGATTVPQ